ncbi:MAG: polyprenyl synthetase [actinobacterium acIB-AMD-6]|nr:MAG: polyprenyl synthetase [actinobacterium acIB-AMD-6]
MVQFLSSKAQAGYRYAVTSPDGSILVSMRDDINLALSDFVKTGSQYLSNIGAELNPVAVEIEKFLLDSGKRLRPLFAYVGLLSTGKQPTPQIIKAVASLELIHVCALIHDDVMDNSDTRRGAPSIHKIFESLHLEQKLSGSASQFGSASAILMGDLALVWSAQMLHTSGISDQELIGVLPFYDEMRVELMAGQYLDVFEQSLATQSIERSMKVARFKSGKYTIERPLHFGGALGNGSVDLLKTFTEYGIPLGEAFQLRDDMLGVFGNPKETGKPAGDDLREGKRTALIAATFDKANKTQMEVLNEYFGDPNLSNDQISLLQEIIVETGAQSHIESVIKQLAETSLNALTYEGISLEGKQLLQELVHLSTNRKI